MQNKKLKEKEKITNHWKRCITKYLTQSETRDKFQPSD